MEVDVKTKRSRLFKTSKPLIRVARLFNQDGSYGEDMGVLWAAYKANSFQLKPGLEPTEFGNYIRLLAGSMTDAVIAEDVSNEYESGKGPIAFIGIKSDGWRYEPHVDYFAWATPRNKLRVTVSFLQFMRYHKEVGVCVVRSLAPHVNLFKRASKYTLLNYLGKIFKGTPRGDEYVFSVAGKKKSA